MTCIAYLMLAHGAPDRVIAQVRLLAGAGDRVALHYDRRAPAADAARLRAALGGVAGVVLVARRRCGWGDWSLVAATLATARAARAAFPEATHFHLISGDCAPIRPRHAILAALAPGDRDFIETHDFFESGWIRTGLREDRLLRFHPLNERRHRHLFYALLGLQRRLGIRRRLPSGLRIRIGAQWWLLRRDTLDRVLDLARARPGLERFFRLTWIPDETFFQSLVRHVTPAAEIENRPPTFLLFGDYGVPAVFHEDHYQFLTAQDAFFARKIAPGDAALRARLAGLYRSPAPDTPRGRGGALLHRAVTGAGRRGAPRAWERPPPPARLDLVACKRWHVSKRLAAALGSGIGAAALGHVFDEEEAGLPGLGGLEHGLFKRLDDPVTFLATLLAATGARRLVLCADPARHALIGHLAAHWDLRLLEIDTPPVPGWLLGHAIRTGILPPGSRLPLPPGLERHLRETLAAESGALGALDLPHHLRIDDALSLPERRARIGQFAEVTPDALPGIVADENLLA